MTQTAEFRSDRDLLYWPRRADAWLDARGKWAWLAAMVTGFIVFVPLGLAILAWLIWEKKMFGKCRSSAAKRFDFSKITSRSSGNLAFDNYRAETLQRLEQEQEAFEGFMTRLREARDKQEFDRFMEDRARTASALPETLSPAGAEGSASRRGAE